MGKNGNSQLPHRSQNDAGTSVKTTEENTRELTGQELEAVAGGKSCANGQHIPAVVLTC
jgi:hypothetical protein